MRARRRRVGRLVRRARPRARAVRRATACELVPVDAHRGRHRALLRGLLQRHPLAALPRRHRAPDVPPAVVGRVPRVNQRFAEAAAEQAAQGATVWVHDYQLQLVPRMLRELRPDLRIGFFHHIPFPPLELFAQLPWRAADHRGPARRRPRRVPARRRRRRTSCAPCAGSRTCTTRGQVITLAEADGPARPARARRGVPHLDRLARASTRSPARPTSSERAKEIRARPRRPARS